MNQRAQRRADLAPVMNELEISLAEARRFLTLLDETATEFTFQTFDDNRDRKDPKLARILHGTLAEHAEELTRLNQRGAGIFVMVQEGDGIGRGNEHVTRIRAVFQEDDGDGKPLPLEPHIINESSPGKHHRYLLTEGLSVEEFRPVQARLVVDYGSDKNAQDPARVLRLPGFYHRKIDNGKGLNGQPFMVHITHESGALPYEREELLKAIPPLLRAERRSGGDPSGAAVQIDDRTYKALRSALAFMRADDRELWVRLGHALKELSDVGRGLWLEWSQTSQKYDPQDAARVWDSFKPEHTGYAAVFAEAQRQGWVNPSAKEPIPPKQPDARLADHWPRLEENDKAEMLDSDRANAVRLATVFGQQLLHVEHIGWHTWTATHWRRSDEEAVRIASQLSRIILGEAATVAEAASREASEERREALANRAGKLFTCAHKSESRVRVDAALWFARALLNIHIEELNRDLYALNVQNGVIELHTGELRKHRRTDFITRCCPGAYDPKAKAPKWDAFLRRIFADNVAVIDFVQRAAGYSLTGDIGEQCLFILHGSGANGKSVLLEVLGHMLGAYAKQAAPDLLLAKTQDRHPTEIADLFGSRLVTAIETSEGRRLAEALVKQMTGGDKMKARFMRQDFFEFDATHKLWLATNHKPQVCGTDYAIWRRIRLIPFDVTIPENERDPKLAAKLIAEELPGILTWAVQGCLAWQEKGLKPPEKVQAATKAYREEMDVLAGFLGECCVIHTNAHARASALYTAYKKWCETAGEYCIRQTIFGGQLTERGFERYTNNGVWYRGIGLVTYPPVG